MNNIEKNSKNNKEIINHSATMWKYVPINKQYYKEFPEYINKYIKIGKNNIISARVRGKKHKHEGTVCHDWYEVGNFKNIIFSVIADGASSKKFSNIGAKKCCKVAIGYLIKETEKLLNVEKDIINNLKYEVNDEKFIKSCQFFAKIIQNAIIKAYESIESEFYCNINNKEYEKVLKREIQLDDFATTILATIIIPINDEKNENLVITCQIGDGLLSLVDTNSNFENCIKILTDSDNGLFSGETDFITSFKYKTIEDLQRRTKISKTTSNYIFIMTDGVCDDYFPNDKEIIRLYIDLILNNIIINKNIKLNDTDLANNQKELLHKIPLPTKYPWVNNQDIKIELNYANKICEKLNISLKDILENKDILALAKNRLDTFDDITDLSERLKIWLDNYVERGSFDDRTLIIIQL